MIFASLERVFRALGEAGITYLVVGGVAVNAHGYQRLTRDLDLVIDLERANVSMALDVLDRLGYRPVLPVPLKAFVDAGTRRVWHEERDMEVFSLAASDGGVTVDIFAYEPFTFAEERERALVAEIAPGLQVPFVAADTLIRMKERSGRPRDQDDVQHLQWIQKGGDDSE